MESAEHNDESLGGSLPELREICLQNLDSLTSIIDPNNIHGRKLNHLTSLQLLKCNKIEYLFSFSMAQNLSSLQELKIILCEKIEQIVKKEKGEREITVEFPRVETLILEQLPKLTGSSSLKSSDVKWLASMMVKVERCPKIQKSMLGTVERPLLKRVSVTNCQPWEHGDPENNINYLFNLIDELSKLKKLEIKDSKELKKYMEMVLQESSFTQLETVEVLQCDNELNKFLCILLDRSNKLEQLTIARCEQLEQVFDLTKFVAEKQIKLRFPSLKTMQLLCLPNLKFIWNKDPMGILELGNLVKLEIIECGLLKVALSIVLVEKLVLLEVLKIESCEMIEQVVEDDNDIHDRSFPKLKDLQLASLPKLIKFNSGHRNFIFPDLRCLRIEKCPKLNVLSNQMLPINEWTSDHERQNEMMRPPCPRLQKLKLAGIEIFEDMSQGKYSRIPLCDLEAMEVDSFSRLTHMWIARSGKLETLVVRNCNSLRSLVLPSNCFNLKEIEISSCNILEKISTDPEQGKTDKKTFHNLKSIILENLEKLLSFSLDTREFSSLQVLRIVNCPMLETFPRNNYTKEDSALNKHSTLVLFDDKEEDSQAEGKMKMPPQLESLELADLPNMLLWKQEPQIPVFQKLTFLKIMRCRSFETLFSIPVAQQLSLMKLLTLYGCVNMVQVLRDDGGGNRKRVFEKLETLVLKHLPKLTSFCEQEVDFGEFPELKMVRVEDVPKMKTFVKWPLKTPKLSQVHVTYITKFWLGDLNGTVTYLHKNHDTIKDEVWETDQSNTRHHANTAESSSQSESRFKDAA